MPKFAKTFANRFDMCDMIDFSTPLAGLNQAESSVNQVAAKVATFGFPQGDSVDLSSEAVSLIQAKNDFAANTKVIQTEDSMTKSLLNLVA